MNPTTVRMKPSFRRSLRAQFRDLQALAGESRRPLILLGVIIFGGAAIFYFFHSDPVTGQRFTFSRSLYGAFTLLFFEDSLGYPQQGYLQILYFLIPILGVTAVVDGVVSFGTALVDKQARGQKWQLAMASTYNNHVIICGIGKVGYRVALELLKLGREVVAVESDSEGRFIENIQALGIPVIIADARPPETLVKAGVAHADAIIPCTEHELTNLDIALDARELKPDIKIVMRMFDADLAARIEKGFGIHTAYSVSALAAPTIAAASLRISVRSSFYVEDDLLNVSEIVILPGTALTDWTLGQMEERLDCSVVGRIENGATRLHPDPAQPLLPGIRLLVLADVKALQRIEALNTPTKN
jgi:voltage-gated potassium channel